MQGQTGIPSVTMQKTHCSILLLEAIYAIFQLHKATSTDLWSQTLQAMSNYKICELVVSYSCAFPNATGVKLVLLHMYMLYVKSNPYN